MDALETAVALMVRKPNVPRSMVALAILGLQARNDYEAEGESLRRERKNAKAAGYRAESRATAMAKTLAALQADFDASAHGALKGEMELVANERDALKRRADVLEAEVQQLTGQADAMRREYTARLESVYSAINGPFPKKARQEASSTALLPSRLSMHDYFDEYLVEQQAHNALRNTLIVERLETELQAAIESRDRNRARAATAKKEVEALKATAAKGYASTSLKRELDAVTKERNDLKLRVQALEASLHQSTSDIVDVRQHYIGRLEAMRQLLPADQQAANATPVRWVRAQRQPQLARAQRQPQLTKAPRNALLCARHVKRLPHGQPSGDS
ncbi:hypothetical protein SDRG_15624 [Saprolegnia diclina VS20]|uniref:Uncharacterized protein n=1 Tax=Saprolegnia diclina (strain VS20) TaxID=1156394 RepID=T0RAH9_SAPDV|nr:hypothetical protein SDRG_15624 [Saprolegnia diclina VS20]EQC26532.1 hypothetical protein SDRG_15624 [Saprolegnia diclina VS20]|eukprot:XP_008620025.1 hypothetical protein SDRG_15624 [Saprolegnia diclina VS20]